MKKLLAMAALLFCADPVPAQQLGFGTIVPGDSRAPYASPNLGPVLLDKTYFQITREGFDHEPIMALRKISAHESIGNEQNAAAVFLAEKWTTASNARVQGGFSEAIDYVGWTGIGPNNFVEGWRTHGLVLAAKGSAYGLISFGGAPAGVVWKYLIGTEGDVGNSTAHAPSPNWFDRDHFSAAFVATMRGTHRGDVAYLVNPYNEVPFRTGVLVGENSTDHTAFASRAGTVVGLDLTLGSQSWSAISIDPLTPIRVANKNMLFGTQDGTLILGADAIGVMLTVGGSVKLIEHGPPNSGGPGYRALRVLN